MSCQCQPVVSEAPDGADVLDAELAAGGSGQAEVAVLGVGAQALALESRVLGALDAQADSALASVFGPG